MGRELEPALAEIERWANRWLRQTAALRPSLTLGSLSNVRRSMATTASPLTPDDVRALVQERNIRFIRLWFTDILGQLKAFSINATELTDAFEGGMGFDGSSITGFNPIEESDMIAMPDPTTFAILPWRPEEQGVARMFCDILTPERTPYEGDPRHVLRRAVERAKAMGFDHYYVGPELEYFYFKDPNSTEVLDEGGYFDLTTLDAGSDLRRETVLALEQLGHPDRVRPPRGRARASTRSTCATRTR